MWSKYTTMLNMIACDECERWYSGTLHPQQINHLLCAYSILLLTILFTSHTGGTRIFLSNQMKKVIGFVLFVLIEENKLNNRMKYHSCIISLYTLICHFIIMS